MAQSGHEVCWFIPEGRVLDAVSEDRVPYREPGLGELLGEQRAAGRLRCEPMTLNGAPVAFNENIRNSTQSGRQFRFRALSVDLLAGARLTKSSTPDLIDGGIGSNIDIETAGGLDGVTHGGGLVGGEVVHDHDIAGAQRRHQHLLHIGQEGRHHA